MVRSMFVGAEVYEIVTPPFPENTDGYRFGRLRADLDAFTEGRVISIAEDPYKKPNSTYLARTDPIEHEIWDIRSRDPKPAIRVLGAFSEPDMFVALVWAFRESLGGPRSREWRDLIERCKAEWRKLFPTYQPHKGDSPRDYVSQNAIAV